MSLRGACISIREIFVSNLLVAPQLRTVSSDSHINWSAAQWVELNNIHENRKSHRDERQTSSHYHANNWTHYGIRVSIIFIFIHSFLCVWDLQFWPTWSVYTSAMGTWCGYCCVFCFKCSNYPPATTFRVCADWRLTTLMKEKVNVNCKFHV